jgi:hypothetical protein
MGIGRSGSRVTRGRPPSFAEPGDTGVGVSNIGAVPFGTKSLCAGVDPIGAGAGIGAGDAVEPLGTDTGAGAVVDGVDPIGAGTGEGTGEGVSASG